MPEIERPASEIGTQSLPATVTVHKRGTLSLNRAAYVALAEPAAVELLYDAENKIVGFRKVDPRSRNASFVRSTQGAGNGPYLVSAMAFLGFYGIGLDKTQRWNAYVEDDILCIDMGQPGTPVTSNRSRHD